MAMPHDGTVIQVCLPKSEQKVDSLSGGTLLYLRKQRLAHPIEKSQVEKDSIQSNPEFEAMLSVIEQQMKLGAKLLGS